MLQRPTILTSFIILTSRHFTPLSHIFAHASTTTTITDTSTTTPKPLSSNLKLLQVQVVHRHGDRTPITPMKNVTFWKDTLPHPEILSKLSSDVELIRQDGVKTTHSAGGKGPFGQLTNLGLLQMIDLGRRLREELLPPPTTTSSSPTTPNHHPHRLFPTIDAFHPHRIRVTSTDFPRSLQSVQALLVGLFPDGLPSSPTTTRIPIDARHTHLMIPDPQPRRTKEQEVLEKELASRPHVKEKDESMRELQVRVSEVLRREVLGDGAEDVSFGVGEEKGVGMEEEPLPWAQLAEITKCLKVRDLLPSEITTEDQEAISSHAAWRWFENLRHPRLARLAMHGMVSLMIENAHNDSLKRKEKQQSSPSSSSSCTTDNHHHDDDESHPLLHIFSGHDSTLIGLMCAFKLEQPAVWPEYSSYLKMELWEEDEKHHYVRFSLNGEVLRSYWGVAEDGDEPVEMVELERLKQLIEEEEEGETGEVV